MIAQQTSFFDRLNHWLKNSISMKVASIGILILILLIPSTMIQSLINEREYTNQNAVNEVSSKWGNEQTLTGPILVVPFKKYIVNSEKQTIETTDYAYFLPDELNINGKINPEKRYRGIYEVVLYNAMLKVSGRISIPNFNQWNIPKENINYKEAFLCFGISDMRGIKDKVSINWNKKKLFFNPGVGSNSQIVSGVNLPIDSSLMSDVNDFSFEINLNGSKQLYFIPVGTTTNIKLNAPWKDPGFDGAFLPDKRNINKNGFTAEWKILDLNRNFPQKWYGDTQDFISSSFGLKLLIPVDHYQKSLRTAKYAVFIIVLTFLVFFFVEVLNKKRIHPFQYLLVGIALCLFYSLLLSISEHIPFNFAYLISAITIISTVSLFALSVLKSKKLSVLMSLILVILYSFIYIIIQLQDFALLVGNIGLFFVLAIIMYLSRKIHFEKNNESVQTEN